MYQAAAWLRWHASAASLTSTNPVTSLNLPGRSVTMADGLWKHSTVGALRTATRPGPVHGPMVLVGVLRRVQVDRRRTHLPGDLLDQRDRRRPLADRGGPEGCACTSLAPMTAAASASSPARAPHAPPTLAAREREHRDGVALAHVPRDGGADPDLGVVGIRRDRRRRRRRRRPLACGCARPSPWPPRSGGPGPPASRGTPPPPPAWRRRRGRERRVAGGAPPVGSSG